MSLDGEGYIKMAVGQFMSVRPTELGTVNVDGMCSTAPPISISE